jgi:hypothetical protein
MFTVLSSYTSDYTITGLRLDATSTRLDAGAQYRHSPTSTLSIKGGIGAVNFSAAGNVTLTTASAARDVKVRHAFSIGDRHQVTWGVELAREPANFTGVPVPPDTLTALVPELAPGVALLEGLGLSLPPVFLDGQIADHSEVVYASERMIAGSHLQFDAAVVVTAVTEHVAGSLKSALDAASAPFLSAALPAISSVRPQPRIGAVVRFAPGRLLRVAYQATTSALGSQDTLGPVATAGIPVDDILDNQFGDIFRYRAQLEWQWSARTFTRGFVEHKQFGSLTSIRDPFVSNVTDYFAREPLSRLRNQLRVVSQLNVASPPLLENTIATGAGSDVWLAGLTLNQMLSRQVSLASQYYWTRSATRPATGASTRMLFYPDRAFSVGATWISPHHVYVSASMMYRSDRLGLKDTARVGLRSLVDSAETVASTSTLLAADWTGQMAASWETPSKHWSIEMLATDLFASAMLHDVVRQPAISMTVKYRR